MRGFHLCPRSLYGQSRSFSVLRIYTVLKIIIQNPVQSKQISDIFGVEFEYVARFAYHEDMVVGLETVIGHRSRVEHFVVLYGDYVDFESSADIKLGYLLALP